MSSFRQQFPNLEFGVQPKTLLADFLTRAFDFRGQAARLICTHFSIMRKTLCHLIELYNRGLLFLHTLISD